MNPDIVKERRTISFNVNGLTNVLDGGEAITERRREVGMYKKIYFSCNPVNSGATGYHLTVSYSRGCQVALSSLKMRRTYERLELDPLTSPLDSRESIYVEFTQNMHLG